MEKTRQNHDIARDDPDDSKMTETAVGINAPDTVNDETAVGINPPDTVNDETRDAKPEIIATKARVWQIDASRGIAIILMTVFHALVDIRDFFGFADIRYFEPPYLYIGRSSAILFIFISGISCRFSKNNVRRGLIVLLCGMAVTLATYVAVRDLYIRFGILHFLGSAMIITGALERVFTGERKNKTLRRIMYLAAPLSLLAGRFFAQIRTSLPFLFVFGITASGFASYDFYPLFPWLGVYFAGYAAGYPIFKNRERLAAMKPGRAASLIFKPICALGRASLVYYMLHQPALLVVFFAVEMFRRVAFNL